MSSFEDGFSKGWNRNVYVSLPFLPWPGAALHFYNLPGYGFWDALIWPYYIGRYIAAHFTLLT